MKNPLLYKIVDKLFHAVNDKAPEFMQSHPKISAGIYGAGGTFTVLRGTQLLTERLLPDFYNSGFKTIEEVCIAATIIGGVAYVKNKFGTFKEMKEQYPVYTPGMTATWITSLGTAMYDIMK
ncbi:TPA: hypothetical protein HA235_03370 [Candidatus Woesearchaeota archaeon]|nr:hypothetical protein [Candidatus Woesearchaeota archaeon]HIH31722.1 hypothetical protein [Candidatus Woesearchaeota archaeon]HIH55026.1 hypothetical protein [Candidatus Woesearchaeota archaeon]HIJ01034.1 hypothetical protein [Candidatus Woesearchaeota archaeon]HIJ14750.1 hypothetical protein [Candidatus Woesearchaeota archaeon]